MTRIDALRESVTQAAALGFAAGDVLRLALDGVGGMHGLLVNALCLPLGAVAAAVAAGVLLNLIGLPALCALVPGGRLPEAAYRAACAVSGLAAFGGVLAASPALAV